MDHFVLVSYYCCRERKYQLFTLSVYQLATFGSKHILRSPKHRRNLMILEHIMHTVKLHLNIATQHVELT